MVVCRRGQKRRLSRVWAEDDDMEDIIVIDAQQAPSSPPLPPGTKSHTVRRLSHDASGTARTNFGDERYCWAVLVLSKLCNQL